MFRFSLMVLWYFGVYFLSTRTGASYWGFYGWIFVGIAGSLVILWDFSSVQDLLRRPRFTDWSYMLRVAVPAQLSVDAFAVLLLAGVLISLSPASLEAFRSYVGVDESISMWAALLAAPIVEEFIFRGVLFNAICRLRGSRAAVIATSVLFGALHATLLPQLAMGLIAGLLRLRTQTLIVPIVFHAIGNAVLLSLDRLDRSLRSSDTIAWQLSWRDFGWEFFAVATAVFLIGLPRLRRFFRENWPVEQAPSNSLDKNNAMR
jgi:membrane protease YdiL (CAAX protease family)